MTPKQLERIGRRVWDGRWKSPLARALGMTYAHINCYTLPADDPRHFEIPRVVELACLWIEEHPAAAKELGLTDRQAGAREL